MLDTLSEENAIDRHDTIVCTFIEPRHSSVPIGLSAHSNPLSSYGTELRPFIVSFAHNVDEKWTVIEVEYEAIEMDWNLYWHHGSYSPMVLDRLRQFRWHSQHGDQSATENSQRLVSVPTKRQCPCAMHQGLRTWLNTSIELSVFVQPFWCLFIR